MIVCDPATRPAVESFRALLEADPTGTRQQHAAIREQLVASNLLFGDSPLPLCFAPAFITRGRLEPLRRQVVKLMNILFKLEDSLRHPYWLDLLNIDASEQELIRLPSRIPAGRAISRVDGFLSAAQPGDLGYRLVELNVDSPGGGAFMDVCARLLRKTPAWRDFCRRHPGRYLATDQRVLPLLLQCWKDWGGQGKPRIAIVDWITVNTVEEFEVLRRRFLASGVETIIADPRELEYRDGRLRCYDGKPIDLVYRRVLVEDLLANRDEARPLLAACRDQAVCLVNPFSCKPLTVKSLLALFFLPEAEKLLSRAELSFLHSLVPWTAMASEAIVPQLRAERESLVLKPADGWGAQGIYLGWTLDESAWDEALEVAIRDGYVAQRRVPIPQEPFPVPVGEGWDFVPFRVDFDPYMFGRGLADPLVRMANSDVLNVKAGAQIAVTWVLD